MRPVLLALPLLYAAPALAHDVWMQTDKFNVPVGTVVPYRVYSGHGTSREPWELELTRLDSLRTISTRGPAVLSPTRTSEGSIRFTKPGTYIVALVSNLARSDLPAVRFNDYARAEGLTPVLAMREKQGTTASNGRELYSRRTKMLIRVGNASTPQSHITVPIGMTLELVPGRDPFAVRAGQPLPVRVFYHGRPLAGATVKLTNLDADATPVATIVTNAAGNAVFRHPGSGRWQLNTIWSRPITGADAEFETIFSSLTFGS
jgi:uncharacterized GH25 family protein